MSTGIGTTSGAITFTGLGSGTDFNSIIEKMVEVEQFHINRLTYWASEWASKIDSIQGLNTRVASLYDYAKNWNENFEFYAKTSASSNESVLTVTNTPLAKAGAHTVEVASATQHQFASIGFAASTAVISGTVGSSLTILVGSTAITLAYGANYSAGQWDVNATLADFAIAIDAADAAGSDVLEAAEIIDDGSDENNYRLLLTAKTAGSANAISVAADPTNLALDGDQAAMIDSVIEETAGWRGSAAINPGGTYYGHTNKRFTFEVMTNLSQGVIGTDDITILWVDEEGHGGSFVVSTAGTYSVYQGVNLTFSAGGVSGTLYDGDSFGLDVWSTTIQAGQDSGLAQVEQWTHTGFVDADVTPITSAAGTFDYSYGGIAVSVSVEAGDTLSDLVTAINADANNPGVTASVLNDGLGLATSYHLVLTGDNTGAANQISDLDASSLDAFTNSFNNTQQAQNAMVKIDGFPLEATDYIQRSSNRITDIIEGVELKLHSEGTSNVTIENDKSTIAQRIIDFVNSVNFVLEYIKEETKYDADTGESGLMIGNYAFQIVQSQIKSIMTSSVGDLTDGVDTYTTLTQIGIKSDPDNQGLFTVDSTVLDDALDTDLEGVAKLFITQTEGGTTTDGVAELMREKTADLTDSYDGPMNVLIKNYNDIIENIYSKIEDEEDRVAAVRARLVDQFARLEATLTTLNQQQSQLEYQIDQLPGKSSSSSD